CPMNKAIERVKSAFFIIVIFGGSVAYSGSAFSASYCLMMFQSYFTSVASQNFWDKSLVLGI
ncbi:MAG: hypothetical protein ACK41O_25745, partial [Runella zeae]